MNEKFSEYVTLRVATSQFGLYCYFTTLRGFSISSVGSLITREERREENCFFFPPQREGVTFRVTRRQEVGKNISGCHSISYCCR
jgi:hypothetical protein